MAAMARLSSPSTSTTFTHSRTLFLDDTGAPLRFYIRPGSTKAMLLPLVTHGGGVLCRLQEPGAVLLAEFGPGPHGKDHLPARYVLDCVERNERLELGDYRQRPTRDQPPPSVAAESRDPDLAPRGHGGRSAYTRGDDVTILLYVRDHASQSARVRGRGSLLGNEFWRQLERLQLTGHSWQSMRDRYLRHLRGHEQDYQLDSRTVIPAPIHLRHGNRDPATPWERERPPVPKPGPPDPGKMQPTAAQHRDANRGEERDRGGGSPEASPEEECFNIIPIAIKEFGDDDSPVLTITDVEELQMETEVHELQMETESLPQQLGADKLPEKAGTLAEFVMNDESQSQSQSQTHVDTFSPTPSQDEVDSAIKAIEMLTREHNLDICGATQVLLKNNGDLMATMHFMATGHRPDGRPIWTHQDDLDLESEEQHVKERLVKKFGADNLAKRQAFKNS